MALDICFSVFSGMHACILIGNIGNGDFYEFEQRNGRWICFYKFNAGDDANITDLKAQIAGGSRQPTISFDGVP